MNLTSILIGVAVMLFAAFAATLLLMKPESLSKLGPMKEKFGKGPGTAIWATGYVVVPLIAGVVFVWAGMNDISLF